MDNDARVPKLAIKSIIVNKGFVMNRIKIRARGRADRISNPFCNIEIMLTDNKEAKDGSEG